MSKETFAAIETAIQAHMVATDAGYLTEWVLLTTSVSEELKGGQRWHFTLHGEDQPVHSIIGLMRHGLIDYENVNLRGDSDD